MGFLSKLFAPAVGDTLKTASSVVREVRNTFAKKLPPDEQAAFDLNMLRIEAELGKGQMEVNKAEAQSGKIFALWRPYIGWVLGTALIIYLIPQYSIATWFWLKDCITAGGYVPYPLAATELIKLLGGMLGLTFYRTLEKFRGVQNRH